MSPEEPKTPESEKIKAHVSAQLFKEGSAMKARVGEDYVKDINRRTLGRSAGIDNMNRELNKRDGRRSVTNAKSGVKVAAATLDGEAEGIAVSTQGGVSRREDALSRGSSMAVNAAGNLVNTLDGASRIDQAKTMSRFEQKNSVKQMALDGAAGIAALGLEKKWDSDAAKKEEEERRKKALEESLLREREAGAYNGWTNT